MQWPQRWGQALLRPLRAARSLLRAGGSKMRKGWTALGTGPKGALARVAVVGAALAVAWSLFIGGTWLAGALTARLDGADSPSAEGEAQGARASLDVDVVGDTPSPPAVAPAANESPRAPVVSESPRDPEALVRALTPPAPEAAEDGRPAPSLAELALPVSGSVRQPSGWRRHVEHGYWYYEPGVEIAAEDPTVYAVLPGTVVQVAAATAPYAGHAIVIDHGDGLTTEYKPLQLIYVVPGQYVSARAPIGQTAGSVVFTVSQNGEPLDAQAVWVQR